MMNSLSMSLGAGPSVHACMHAHEVSITVNADIFVFIENYIYYGNDSIMAL